ncbi:MAG: hypothetical protein ACT4P6_14940 [Gemmatimonadaceae bacterium]
MQLQKSLFLLSKNLDKKALAVSGFYQFDAYDYGPFCGAVYADAEQLEVDGMVEIERPPNTRFKLYRATASGRARAQELRNDLSERVRKYLDAVVGWCQTLGFTELVAAIYRAYPEMRANSVFRG